MVSTPTQFILALSIIHRIFAYPISFNSHRHQSSFLNNIYIATWKMKSSFGLSRIIHGRDNDLDNSDNSSSSWNLDAARDALGPLLYSSGQDIQQINPEQVEAIRYLQIIATDRSSGFNRLFSGRRRNKVERRSEKSIRGHIQEVLDEEEEDDEDEDYLSARQGVLDTFGGRDISVHFMKRGHQRIVDLQDRAVRSSGRRMQLLINAAQDTKTRLNVQLSTLSGSTGSVNPLYSPPEWNNLTTEAKTKLAKLLSWESLSRWDFDPVEVAGLSSNASNEQSACPLLLVGWAILCAPFAQEAMQSSLPPETMSDNEDVETSRTYHYNFSHHMHINPKAICNFLREVESRYNHENPYHNNIHAADVTQTTHCLFQMIDEQYMREIFDPLQIFSLLLAATFHDVAHPGQNNIFHQNAMTTLSIRYNNMSTLEQMHSATGQSLLLGEGKTNDWDVFDGFSQEEKLYARNIMTSSILGTDMSKHFSKVEELESLMDKVQLLAGSASNETLSNEPQSVLSILAQNLADEDDEEKEESNPELKGECRKLADMLMGFLLHSADISNPAKPEKIAIYWADAALGEFFRQGDKEKELGLPVSPLCDRDTVKRADSQIGFSKFVIKPTYMLLGDVIPRVKEEVLPTIDETMEYWRLEKMRLSRLKSHHLSLGDINEDE